VAPLNK